MSPIEVVPWQLVGALLAFLVAIPLARCVSRTTERYFADLRASSMDAHEEDRAAREKLLLALDASQRNLEILTVV